MIAAISTSYQEADILDLWIRHVLAEGIDRIYIADKLGSDNSREVLENYDDVQWVDDTEPYHRQAWWTNNLATQAHDDGAEWIFPLDVDEFPYATDRNKTVADALADCEHNKLTLRVWPHKDWDNRFEAAHRLGKVCYRWSPDAQVVMGSHDVSIPGGTSEILDLREWQYRSFEHFCRKTADRNATLEPAARARQDGWHHLRLEGFDEILMSAEWQKMQSQPTIYDPVPSRA